jgi:hypothetical protein
MLRAVTKTTARRSHNNSRKSPGAQSATCLLCQVLAPIVVQHRHLPFNCFPEAKTVLKKRTS